MHYPGDVVLRCQRFAGASREHVIFFASSPKPHTSNSSNAREQHDCNESNVSGPHIPVAGTENARYAEPSAGQQEHQEQQQQEGLRIQQQDIYNIYHIHATNYCMPSSSRNGGGGNGGNRYAESSGATQDFVNRNVFAQTSQVNSR